MTNEELQQENTEIKKKLAKVNESFESMQADFKQCQKIYGVSANITSEVYNCVARLKEALNEEGE